MTTAPERDVRARLSLLERIADSDSDLQASPVFVAAQLLCFAVWILVEYTPAGNPRSLRFLSLAPGGFGRDERGGRVWPERIPPQRASLYRDKGKYCGQQHI